MGRWIKWLLLPLSTPPRGFPNPEGNGQKPRLKAKQFFHTVFLPGLFMLWLEVCQHFQERHQAGCFILLIVWFLQISALLFFYNTKQFGIFFYSCNTFIFSWQSMSFSCLVLFFWKTIVPGFLFYFFVTSTHPPCPIKIKSDGSCQRSAKLGWGTFLICNAVVNVNRFFFLHSS